jgi:hypothetical protein
MSDWWTRHELQRVADELQRIREERLDPKGTAGCLAILTMIAIPCLYIVPKTIEGFYQQNFMKPKDYPPQEVYDEYKQNLREICLIPEKRLKNATDCKVVRTMFLNNYCPPIHKVKKISDPKMCAELLQKANIW